MKKLSLILFIYFFGTIISCCSSDGRIIFHTIESVNVQLFSFDEEGMYPYLENYNPTELGISVLADSLSTRIELASNFSTMDKAYACDDNTRFVDTNRIDSLNISTIYNFNNNYPAGSNINNLLLHLDRNGETSNININDASSTFHYFKFSEAPTNDSLQFNISGRITDKGSFIKTTELVILE